MLTNFYTYIIPSGLRKKLNFELLFLDNLFVDIFYKGLNLL